ncbi:uncharacterized protein TRAVEDRAFT_52753 [Trametes versicolor FP-101664 SS1]|uniref:uncharacterized protein n=1 Tax=Trametes versicolor (strain FP-101664) TaxID=717944 RepID=UPI0004621465|nr:uncharacterized protein TRAVEDRAFT_52753 [Trametes versicolor FP-101664 SS1]EIW53633.1 hypothetical protein TRAVEDRAFT_52753 [Trametes versicolor FP-101664 SS1]
MPLTPEEENLRRERRRMANRRYYYERRKPRLLSQAASDATEYPQPHPGPGPSSARAVDAGPSNARPSSEGVRDVAVTPGPIPSPKPAAPIRIPLTPDQVLIARLAALNDRLCRWGYTDELDSFNTCFKRNYVCAKADAPSMEAWTGRAWDWIGRGDDILDEVQDLVCSGVLDCFSPESMGKLWEQLSAAAFKVQYMMAVAQVYLDLEP